VKQQEPLIVIDDPHAPHRLEHKGPLVIMPNNGARLLEAVRHSEAVREQLRREDALDVLRKASEDPNADPRELFALTMKVDPYLVQNVGPNRKQRRAMLARASQKAKRR
jgi:hypothetical protein